MPVVTPSRASIETVNGVWNGDSFLAAIRSSPSSSQRSGVSDRQISPRPCVAMKLIASGVTNCAAIVRSPSFSRSSSSHTTTMRPARISSIASSIGANAPLMRPHHQLLDVLGEHVHLQVDRRAGERRRRGSSARESRGSATPRTCPRSQTRPSARRRRPRSSPSRPRSAAAPAAPRSSRRGRSRPRPPSRTAPTPSTWPCTTWPPRRSCARSGSSRLTRAPAATSASEERRSVSCITSAVNCPPATCRRRSGRRR